MMIHHFLINYWTFVYTFCYGCWKSLFVLITVNEKQTVYSSSPNSKLKHRQTLNFCLKEEPWTAWGYSVLIYVGCGDCLLYPMQNLPNQSTEHSRKYQVHLLQRLSTEVEVKKNASWRSPYTSCKWKGFIFLLCNICQSPSWDRSV
jgi:hypothetical protein